MRKRGRRRDSGARPQLGGASTIGHAAAHWRGPLSTSAKSSRSSRGRALLETCRAPASLQVVDDHHVQAVLPTAAAGTLAAASSEQRRSERRVSLRSFASLACRSPATRRPSPAPPRKNHGAAGGRRSAPRRSGCGGNQLILRTISRLNTPTVMSAWYRRAAPCSAPGGISIDGRARRMITGSDGLGQPRGHLVEIGEAVGTAGGPLLLRARRQLLDSSARLPCDRVAAAVTKAVAHLGRRRIAAKIRARPDSRIRSGLVLPLRYAGFARILLAEEDRFRRGCLLLA